MYITSLLDTIGGFRMWDLFAIGGFRMGDLFEMASLNIPALTFNYRAFLLNALEVKFVFITYFLPISFEGVIRVDFYFK